MPNIRIVTWDEINILIEQLYIELLQLYAKDTHLRFIGVSKGGIIPAVLLSKLWANSTISILDMNEIIDDISFSKQDIVIDNICDTGKTMQRIFDNCFIKPRTMSLFARYSRKFNIDKYAELITNDDWIVFP